MEWYDALIKTWDESQWEFTLALEGLPEDELWNRAHPRLLSVGELAGHIAYWEAKPFDTIVSPLGNPAFGYYTSSVEAPFQLPLSIQEVLAEMERVHVASRDAVRSMLVAGAEHLPVAPNEGMGSRIDHWLRYRTFHTSYHAGQAYSVRHLLGHTTTDN